MNWQQTFAALKYRNYRLWFIGQLTSLFGTWMQSTTLGYLVFELTHSSEYLGYVAFTAGLPSWLFMLYAGVIADRLPRRLMLLITQSVMMVLALVLSVLTFGDWIRPWHILILSFGGGVANAFDAPARQSFVLEMVTREDLTNAIALNSTMFNAALVLGPALGGVTYSLFGPGWCFVLNALSFVAVIAALLLMDLPAQPAPQNRRSATRELREGLRHAFCHPIIRTLIGLIAVTSLFGISSMTLLPAWAVKILGGDATTNGLLNSARGVGALFGALLIASLGRFNFRGKLLMIGMIFFPLTLIIFSYVRWEALALLVMVLSGMTLILTFNLSNSLVQLHAADEMRGRVMSVYSLTFFGLLPIGGLLMGAVAERIGEPTTLVASSLILFVFAMLILWSQPKLRAL
jgi:MFS family permease